LAIEFAAPRVEALGVEALAARLDDSLRLLGARRRAVVPRHRTMQAVVDWSYGLLSQDEQRSFRALGIFTGGFTVEAATAIAMDAPTTDAEAIDRLADLVAKSLVVADVSGTAPRFRLLDTIRAFALEKHDTSGEREAVAHRHIEYYRQLFARAEVEAPARTASDWLADDALEIDNLRAAPDWAFSPGGEASTGVALTATAVPLWIRLSLLEECRGRARQALGALGTASTEDRGKQCDCTPPWAARRLTLPRWSPRLPRHWTSPGTWATSTTSCVHSGVCIFITPGAAASARRSPSRGSSMRSHDMDRIAPI
jgi:predicted ATPase